MYIYYFKSNCSGSQPTSSPRQESEFFQTFLCWLCTHVRARARVCVIQRFLFPTGFLIFPVESQLYIFWVKISRWKYFLCSRLLTFSLQHYEDLQTYRKVAGILESTIHHRTASHPHFLPCHIPTYHQPTYLVMYFKVKCSHQHPSSIYNLVFIHFHYVLDEIYL